MAGQAMMNGQKSVNAKRPDGMLEGVGSFGGNVATLASLQVKLAACDLRDSLKEAAPGLVGLAIAIVMIPAGSVVGMLGVAYVLTTALNWSIAKSLLIVALGGLIIGAVAIVLSAMRLRRSFTSFRRSQDELDRNLAWIRTVLARSGR